MSMMKATFLFNICSHKIPLASWFKNHLKTFKQNRPSEKSVQQISVFEWFSTKRHFLITYFLFTFQKGTFQQFQWCNKRALVHYRNDKRVLLLRKGALVGHMPPSPLPCNGCYLRHHKAPVSRMLYLILRCLLGALQKERTIQKN